MKLNNMSVVDQNGDILRENGLKEKNKVSFRKIKTFLFEDYDSHEECINAANDYYVKVSHMIDSGAKVVLMEKYIGVLLPEISGLFDKRENKN